MKRPDITVPPANVRVKRIASIVLFAASVGVMAWIFWRNAIPLGSEPYFFPDDPYTDSIAIAMSTAFHRLDYAILQVGSAEHVPLCSIDVFEWQVVFVQELLKSVADGSIPFHMLLWFGIYHSIMMFGLDFMGPVFGLLVVLRGVVV